MRSVALLRIIGLESGRGEVIGLGDMSLPA